MRTFRDNAGREWSVEVNVAALKRVRAMLNIDLLEVVQGTLIERLMRDPVLLCDCVYILCKPEVDERGISDEQFGIAMAGDAIEDATQALLEELVSFCPSPRDRKNLGRVLETARSAMEKARDLVEARIESGELERIASRALETAMAPANAGDSSGTAPVSWESIQPP
jgi:hypothetical protein